MDTATAGEAPINDDAPNCVFIMTGFGPFRGVPDNPTSVLIRRLQEDESTLKSRHICETHILETSAEYVREKIGDIYGRLGRSAIANGDDAGGLNSNSNNSTTNNEQSKPKNVILIHLGVNYRGKYFQLEECAYNDATFRIPDERGYKPNRECILLDNDNTTGKSQHKWGKCFRTKLDVKQLCDDLQVANEDVKLSRDAGRFVCNYTYCLSLDTSTTTTQEDHENGEEQTTYYSLFIHVPPFSVVNEDRQYDFILRVIDAIGLQVSNNGDP